MASFFFKRAQESHHLELTSPTVFEKYPWLSQLAGILPLSALVNFIDIRKKLHLLELVGAVPLWNWPVTLAGNRILLANELLDQPCSLDRVGNSVPLTCIDGRYGDSYPCSSPETVRMYLSTQRLGAKFENKHKNMVAKDPTDDRKRTQKLEIILLSRTHIKANRNPSKAWWNSVLSNHWTSRSSIYLVVSTVGWVLWLVVGVGSYLLGCYVAGAFLVLIPGTGILVSLIHGSNPRQLLVDKGTHYNRMVVATEDVNGSNWMVFYGESTIVNSFLNRPLYREKSTHSPAIRRLLRVLLQGFIISQWAMAIAAASLQDWNALIISFWILSCIFSHTCIYTAQDGVKDWLQHDISLGLERYEVTLSSRRALLNTILALNPDTFDFVEGQDENNPKPYREGAMKWLDHVLAKGKSRSDWETATLNLMRSNGEDNVEEGEQDDNKDWRREYWYKYIGEGIEMAKLIIKEAKLTGRKV